MSNRSKSPKLTSVQLVKKLEQKGVKFNIINRTEAVRFFSKNNYYFRMTSYEGNYKGYVDKHNRKEKAKIGVLRRPDQPLL